MMAQEVENDCPICQETLHGTFSVGCTVPCGHLFHRRCFETWQIHCAGKRCPCCNSNLQGFIDKIHITLPRSKDNMLESPEVKLLRRKALSNQKFKRSAMMRHSARRRKVENYQIEEAREPAASDQSHRVSLSSSLQRTPADPVKVKDLEYGDYPKVVEDRQQETGVHDVRIEEDYFAEMEILEDQIPDVAGQIIRNIEQTLRQHRSPTKPTRSMTKSRPTTT